MRIISNSHLATAQNTHPVVPTVTGPQSPQSFIYVSWEIILQERHWYLTPMQTAAIPAKAGVQEGCFSLINPREEQTQRRHSRIQASYLK